MVEKLFAIYRRFIRFMPKIKHFLFLHKGIIVLAVSLVILVFSGIPRGCNNDESIPDEIEEIDSEVPEVQSDLSDILKRGELRALTAYSSIAYYMYQGQPMGYEYDLLKRFADDLGVRLSIVAVSSPDSLFVKLKRGEGDLVGFSLTITGTRRRLVNFTDPLSLSEQVLIQRDESSNPGSTQKMITRVNELAGKTVVVPKGSVYEQRLEHLMNEIGDTINIKTVDSRVTAEDLIERVSKGEIDYTVADLQVALLNQTYYPNIVQYQYQFSTAKSMGCT